MKTTALKRTGTLDALGQPIDPQANYKAWTPFVTAIATVAAEQELRGSNPIVENSPGFFVPSDTPRAEWPHGFEQSFDVQEQAAAAEAEANRITLTASVPETIIMRLTRDLRAMQQGRHVTITRGSTALATDQIVLEYPDAWLPQQA